MSPTYPSALAHLQGEGQKKQDTGHSLGHSTEHLESDGGRKEAEASSHMTKKQQQLDFQMVTGPQEFMREGVLHAVAKLIATSNQVSY